MIDLEYYTLENPFPLVMGLAALWGAAWGVASLAGWPLRPVWVWRSPPLIAGLLILAAWYVQTDREAVHAATEALMTEVAHRDPAAVGTYFALPIVSPQREEWSQPVLTNRINVVAFVERVSAVNSQVQYLSDGRGTLRAATSFQVWAGRGPTAFEFEADWRRLDGRWRIVGLRQVRWRTAGVGNWNPVWPR